MMKKIVAAVFFALIFAFFFAACSTLQPGPEVDSASVEAGTSVTRGGNITFTLLGEPLHVGDRIPQTALVDAFSMEDADLAGMQGKILLISVVPSIDTKVCEAQTHYLSEQGDDLGEDIIRLTVSRDTPFAQKRFAEEAGLTDVRYLSDYKEGAFGRSVGMLMDPVRLLARAVIVVDREGIVHYMQIVPEITHLPDLDKAFTEAARLQ